MDELQIPPNGFNFVRGRRTICILWVEGCFWNNTGGNCGMFCQISGRYGDESDVPHDWLLNKVLKCFHCQENNPKWSLMIKERRNACLPLHITLRKRILSYFFISKINGARQKINLTISKIVNVLDKQQLIE